MEHALYMLHQQMFLGGGTRDEIENVTGSIIKAAADLEISSSFLDHLIPFEIMRVRMTILTF